MKCEECSAKITLNAFEFSINKHGHALCYTHQSWLSKLEKTKKTSLPAKKLYFFLKSEGINSTLEHNDGHKHIDIYIKEKNLARELDGKQHYIGVNALIDLKRDYNSLKNGIKTWRFPNDLINKHFEESSKIILDIINKNEL